MESLLIALFSAVTAALTVSSLSVDFGRIYQSLVSLMFGESTIESLELSSVSPADCTVDYSDGVYEVYFEGSRVITHFSGRNIRNLIAFGITVAYTVTSDFIECPAACPHAIAA